MDCSPSGSSVHEILQARILEWVVIPPPGELPEPGIEPKFLMSPAVPGRFFTTSATWGRMDICICGLLLLLLLLLSRFSRVQLCATP